MHFWSVTRCNLTHGRDIPKWQILKRSQNKNGTASFAAGRVQVEKDYLRTPVVGREELSYRQLPGILIKKYYNNVI